MINSFILNIDRNRIKFYSIVIFTFISYSQGLLSLTPSDPIQYILPVFNPSISFEFIDRITLFLYINFISLFKIDPIYLGSISPFLLWVGIYLLCETIVNQYESNIRATFVLSILFNSSVYILTLSQYLYPTIILVFFELLIFYFLININNNKRYLYFIYILLPFLFFTKIQSIAFIIYLIWQLYKLKAIDYKCIIFTISSFSIILFIYFSINTGTSDYSNYLIKQYNGRSSEIFPPFYAYLFEPSSLIIILSTIFIFIDNSTQFKKLSYLNIWLFLYVVIIYLLTSRGGPLIYNYHLEFLVFGLISTTLYLKKYIEQKKFSLIFSFVLLGIISNYLINVNIDNFHPAKVYYNFINGIVDIQFLITSISLLTICLFFLFYKYRLKIIPYLFLLLIIDSNLKFKADISFKIHESNLIYNFLDNLQNDLLGSIPISQPNSPNSAHKYNMVVKASEFYFVTNKSNFLFIFDDTKSSEDELDMKLKTLTDQIK